ncbi:LysM peptidoglycan-binding domain-containing protein [Fructilactobacillus vespulae]|uniref:LysM peptidoglycan-binding domain-containing protein n=1 Tax=Fructilactobacillus vespulae TaxID=1249630 RepID=UPI0039B58DCD
MEMSKNLKKKLLISATILGLATVSLTTISVNAATKTDSNVSTSKVTKSETGNKEVVIKTGDTVSNFAQDYNTTVKAIADANHLEDANVIFAGNKLIISVNTRAEGQSIYDGWNISSQGAGNVQAVAGSVTQSAFTDKAVSSATGVNENVATPQGNVFSKATSTPANGGSATTGNQGSVTPINSGSVSNGNQGSVAPANVGSATTDNQGSVAPTNSGSVSTGNPSSVAPANVGSATTDNQGSVTPTNSGSVSTGNPSSVAPSNDGIKTPSKGENIPTEAEAHNQGLPNQNGTGNTNPTNPATPAFEASTEGVRAALQAKVSGLGYPEVHKTFGDGTTTGSFSGEMTNVPNVSSNEEVANELWKDSNGPLFENQKDVLGLTLQDVSANTVNGRTSASFTVQYQEK